MMMMGSERKTRHAGLADGLAAIKAYLARERTADQELYGTNWRTSFSNDNQPQVHRIQKDPEDGHPVDDGPDHGYDIERRMEIRPTIRWMAKQWNEGEVVRDEHGILCRIGKLWFSDGTQVERGYGLVDGRLMLREFRMPAGSLLGCQERNDRMRGTDNRERADRPADEALREKHIREGNEYIAETLKAHLPRKIRGGKRKGKRPGPSHEQAKVILAEAYANTPVLPPVKKFPAGLPWQPRELWTIFPSLVSKECEDTAMQSWQDICSATIAREIWDEALSSLKAEYRAVLDALPKARNMTDIGVAAGQSESYARNGGGIRVLQAVNDNLAEALSGAAANDNYLIER